MVFTAMMPMRRLPLPDAPSVLRVEPEPAEGEDERSQRRQDDVMARDRVD
jgi:hypothetical protein